MFEIEIFTKEGFKDSRGEHVLSKISEVEIKGITKVDYASVYIIDGDINKTEAKTIASELLSDKITEKFEISSNSDSKKSKSSVIEVLYKKGVTDTVSESVIKAIKDLGITKEVRVKTGHKYYLHGNISKTVLDKIAVKLLANTLVQEYKIK
ncbi:MAG: phosphoribosylformylglycinamidine synthase subunit PurS [Endomicrobium sp.]|jgi:phosphoribosylformylglycinamidine synthase|nr:phosphoribosylformylglycinamidine synthase subunit PurS [Endomicrobium sp.]MDR2399780.1 phosphoribosylformylglycinamidine synthase subunit PurS [Endomicrobium sp.]